MKSIFRFVLIVIICSALCGCTQALKANARESLDELFTTIDLMDATISDLQAEMEAGHVTSEQLTRMYLDRVYAYDKKLKLNSIIAVNPEALEEAKQLDQERSEGNLRGPLHGIPVVVKANIDIAGMATSAGSNALADMVVSQDAFVVKKLKEAGAVILAQANLSEFAYSSTSSRSTLGGFVHNPYDISKNPGGSSGGTAVAVTANFAAAGIGTDTGGSIRNPSSFNNLYGIRPSKGLTSISGVFPINASRDTTGPITRTAQDMALMLQAMAGTDEKDDFTKEADADALLSDGYMDGLMIDSLKGMRIGYLGSSFIYSAVSEEEFVYLTPDKKIEEMLNRTLADLRKTGAEFVDLTDILEDEFLNEIKEEIPKESFDTFEYDVNKYLAEKGDAAPFKTLRELSESGEYNAYYLYLNWHTSGSDDLASSFAETENPYTEKSGSYYRVPAWVKVLEYRQKVSRILKENDIDAVMYLNYFDVPEDEALISSGNGYNDAGYDMLFGPRLGFPDMSIPMGFSNTDDEYLSEMPLGLSVFADFGQEEKLMQIAYVYEKQAGDYIRRMPDQLPALEDEGLNSFLKELIEKAYSLSRSDNSKKEGRIQIMLNACEKAMNVDTEDVYATYKAAEELAEAYDQAVGK